MHRRRHYIYPDLDALAAAFVCDINQFLSRTRHEGKPVHVALSGGNTPVQVFRHLALYSRSEDWQHVHLYWGDERCVPSSDPQSNYGNALAGFLQVLKIPEENIHPILGEADSPEAEAKRYGDFLKKQLPMTGGYPIFDWIWLGLGEDGHTVSIFPDQMALWKSDRPCELASHPVSGQKRITLTGGVINAARRVAFLAAGKNKSNVVNQIVMKEGNYLNFPASYVSLDSGYVEWYLDMEATSWM